MNIKWAPVIIEADIAHIDTRYPNLSHIYPNNGAKNAGMKKTIEAIYPAWFWVKLKEVQKNEVEMLLKGKIPI